MSPELTLLTINAILLGYAYLWAYPSLPKKTLRAVMTRDIAISAAALVLAALLFAGKGIAFRMLFFGTNWFVFSIVTLCIMETPLFFWFAKKYDLSFDEWDDS